MQPFDNVEDPFDRLEYLENVSEQLAELAQKTSQVTANNTWLLAELNRHAADLTTAVNQLAELHKNLKERIERLEEQQ